MSVKGAFIDSPLPFDPINVPDVNSFDVNGDPNVDPLQEARLEYKKREGTLYVYSNAPETLKFFLRFRPFRHIGQGEFRVVKARPFHFAQIGAVARKLVADIFYRHVHVFRTLSSSTTNAVT